MICEKNLEGVVAKHRDSRYDSSAKWVKIKNPNYAQSEGRHELSTSYRTIRIRRQKQLMIPEVGGLKQASSSGIVHLRRIQYNAGVALCKPRLESLLALVLHDPRK
jgi:hypothetical protein